MFHATPLCWAKLWDEVDRIWGQLENKGRPTRCVTASHAPFLPHSSLPQLCLEQLRLAALFYVTEPPDNANSLGPHNQPPNDANSIISCHQAPK
jgi:hypothetical protein